MKKVNAEEPYNKIIVWLQVALVLALPLLMSPYNFANFEPVKMTAFRMLTFTLFAVWLIKVINSRRLVFTRAFLDIPIILFVFLTIISTLLSVHFHTSLYGELYRYEGLLTILSYIFIFYVALNFVKQKQQLNLVVYALLLSSFLISFYGVFQHFGYDFISWSSQKMDISRSFSTYGNPVFLGAFLSLTLPIILGVFFETEKKLIHIFSAVTLVIVLSSLVFSFTRAAWIGALLATGLFFLFSFKLIRHKKVRLLELVALSIVVIIIVALPIKSKTKDVPLRTVTQRVSEAAQVETGTVATRLYLWKTSLPMIRDNPILGFGPDTYKITYPQYKPIDWVKNFERARSDKVHNDFLQVTISQGLISLLCYLWLLIAFMWISIKNLSRQSMMFAAILAGLLGYVVQLQASFSVFSFAFLFWLFLGILVSIQQDESYALIWKFKKTFSPVVKNSIYIILGFLFILVAITSIRPLLADAYAQKGWTYMKGGVYPQAITQFNKTVASNPSENRYRLFLARAYQRNFELNKNQTDFKQAIKTLNQAEKLCPWEEDIYYFRGKLYQQTGETTSNLFMIDQAISDLDRVIELDPYDCEARFDLGILYANKKMYTEAIEQWKKVVEIDEKNHRAYSNIGLAYEYLKQPSEAIKAYRKALAVDPKNKQAKESLEQLTK